MSESSPAHPINIAIAGGGTGGHVMPAIALADAIRERWPHAQVQFIGALRGLEASLLPARGEQVLLLPMHSVQGASWLQRIRVMLLELPRAIWQVRKSWHTKPDLVIGVGGYASVMGVLAGLISRVPVMLYEQNAYPGMVNRRLAPWCSHIMLGFAEAAPYLPASTPSTVTGNMIREDLLALQRHTNTIPRMLITGGSQGAQILNEILPQTCALLATQGIAFQITHIAGSREGALAQVQQAYTTANIPADVLPFCHDMPRAYQNADILIARSGAMTVCEAAAIGICSVFVPLPHAADNHQWHNAHSLCANDGAIMLEQNQLNPAVLASALTPLIQDAARRQSIATHAKQWAILDAKQRQLQAIATTIPKLGADL